MSQMSHHKCTYVIRKRVFFPTPEILESQTTITTQAVVHQHESLDLEVKMELDEEEQVEDQECYVQDTSEDTSAARALVLLSQATFHSEKFQYSLWEGTFHIFYLFHFQCHTCVIRFVHKCTFSQYFKIIPRTY